MKSDWKEMLSSLYSIGVDSKNFLFDTGLMDAVVLDVPVLSVGNLSVGGTGKTPVVQAILQMAKDRDLHSVLVARNYMARSLGIHQVDVRRADGASYYGDEPFMLAEKFPDVSVWTGPKKYLTAQMALKDIKPNLLVVDDGFQHRSLHRDFDMVLIDASAPVQEETLLPQGRLREGFEALERAHLVALTKVNWATEARVNALRNRIPPEVPVCEIEFLPQPSRQLGAEARVIAVSGIAKPQIFEQNLKDLQSQVDGGFEVLSHQVFADHYDYKTSDADAIYKKVKELGAFEILTTEKDFVKLQVFSQLKELLNPILISTQFRKAPQELYEFLDRSRRH